MPRRTPVDPVSEKADSAPRALIGMLIFLMGLIVVLGAGVAGGWAWYQNELVRRGPATEDGRSTVVLIERGAGVAAIADHLEYAGLISDARLFRLAARLQEAETDLKAGEYAISSGAPLQAILDQLREGRVILHAITEPEGLTSAMIARLINDSDVLTGDTVEPPAEGVLLPDTYNVTRGDTRAGLIERMRAAKANLLEALWEARAPDLPISTPEEALILASIVEKETGVAEERGLVASVFVNRLRRGMRLQSDPTIIYGLTGGEPLGRGIRRSELDRVTPYNTYQVDGLPPTPIANAGRASLEAVLNPPDTDYLFFVADGTGGHKFSATYAEHNEGVRNLRRLEREGRR